MPPMPPTQSRKKVVPAGYKNYGQYRSQQVRARNTVRKTAAAPTPAATTAEASATTTLKAEQRSATLKSAEQQATTKNALAQKAGYRNYGQQRSELVHKRNAARKAAKLTTIDGYKRGRKKRTKPRFGNNQAVSDAVSNRTGARLARTGPVKGVDGTDGYTGREARLVKNARRRQKQGRTPLSSGPAGGRI